MNSSHCNWIVLNWADLSTTIQKQQDGRFLYGEIDHYLSLGICLYEYSKPDKQAGSLATTVHQRIQVMILSLRYWWWRVKLNIIELLLLYMTATYHCACFEGDELFPSKVRSIRNRDNGSNEAVAVFCTCRLLETDKMVCCDTCKSGTMTVWNRDDSLLWTCNACTM